MPKRTRGKSSQKQAVREMMRDYLDILALGKRKSGKLEIRIPVSQYPEIILPDGKCSGLFTT